MKNALSSLVAACDTAIESLAPLPKMSANRIGTETTAIISRQLHGGTHDGLELMLPNDCVLVMFADGTAYTSGEHCGFNCFRFAGYMEKGAALPQTRSELKEKFHA